MANSGLSDLRAQALKRQRDAGKKLSRISRENGWKLSGGKLDPRRDADKVKRYNATQLKAYLSQLDTFMSRSTQYVPDAHKRPVHKSVFDAYKSKETRFKNIAKKRFDAVADIQLPDTSDNIRERMAKMTPDRRSASQLAAHGHHAPTVRKPENFRNEKAMKKMAKVMDKRLSPDYFQKTLDHNMRGAKRMLRKLGHRDLINDMKNMSAKQFDVLWHYTGFADALAIPYVQAKNMLSTGEQGYEDEVLEVQLEKAKNLIGWAKKLDI